MDWAKEQAICLGRVGAALRADGDTGAAQRAIRDAADTAQANDELEGDVLAALAVAAGSVGAGDLLEALTGRARRTWERAGVAEGWARAGDAARASELAGSIEAAHIRAISEGAGTGELGAALRILEHPALNEIHTRLAARFAALFDGSGIVSRVPDDDDMRTLGAVGQ